MSKARIVTGPDGVSRCSKCGGSAFTRERTMAGKVMLGLLAKKRTTCVVCGAVMG